MNGCTELSVKQTCRFLKKHDDYVILTHAEPDGDTLGSASALCLGLRQLGKRAYIACSDEIPEKFGFFTVECTEKTFTPKTVIACDIADTILMGGYKQEYGDKVELCIDHHISNRKFAKNLLLDGKAAACGEIIFAILKALKVKFTMTVSAALYTAISTDTGCFKYSNTTAATHRIVAELFDMGVDYKNINRIMFETKSRARVEMERMALESMTYHFGGKCAVMVITNEMRKTTGCSVDELEGVTAISRTIEGVLVGVTVKQKNDGKYKISVRTYPPVNASQICAALGGGGHASAAGCELEGEPAEVVERILEKVNSALEDSGAGDYTDK